MNFDKEAKNLEEDLNNLRLHEMAYLPWIAINLDIKDLDNIELNDKTKASLKKLAQEWELTKSEGSDSIEDVIAGELLHNKRAVAAWKEYSDADKLDYLRKKIKWIQKGLDSGEFLNY